ncbi:MAG: preprotein translocase subunit SecE [Blastocatellia bacterium]
MSRVTEFTEDDSVEPQRTGGDGGDEGGRLARLKNLSLGGRIREFYHGVKQEMSKVTWPTRSEVWNTTLVVLIAILFFGFYLWGVDRIVTFGFEALEKTIR